MPPLIEVGVKSAGLRAPGVLGDDDLRAAGVEGLENPGGVEGLVGDEPAEVDVCDQRGDAERVEPLTGQEFEADEISERIGQRDDLGGPAAARATDGLALSPLLCPVRGGGL